MKCLKFDNPEMSLYMASMGKIFRVAAVCTSNAQANKIMMQDTHQTVIAEDCNGLIYLANQYGHIAPSAILEDLDRRLSRKG